MLIVADSLTGQCVVQVVRGHKEKDIAVILLEFVQSLLQGNLNMAYCEWKRLSGSPYIDFDIFFVLCSVYIQVCTICKYYDIISMIKYFYNPQVFTLEVTGSFQKRSIPLLWKKWQMVPLPLQTSIHS